MLESPVRGMGFIVVQEILDNVIERITIRTTNLLKQNIVEASFSVCRYVPTVGLDLMNMTYGYRVSYRRPSIASLHGVIPEKTEQNLIDGTKMVMPGGTAQSSSGLWPLKHTLNRLPTMAFIWAAWLK